MKNKAITVAVFCVLCLLALVGCDPNEELLPAAEAYDAFEVRLANTSALSAYDLTVTSTVGEEVNITRYVLTTNKLGEPVAMKENAGRTEYYVRGVRYFSDESGRLMKAAISLDDFLSVTRSDFVAERDRISDIESLKNGVAFNYASADFDDLRITAYFDDVFLTSISAEASYSDNGQNVIKTVSYKYRDPGLLPEIDLPEDLDDHEWL